MKFIKYLSALLLCTAASGCMNLTLGDSEIAGRVLDDATGKPIPDAIVHVVWEGNIHGIVQGSTVCYHVEAVVTDVDGKFTIPSWRRAAVGGERRIADTQRIFDIYKEGYGNFGPGPHLDRQGDTKIKRTEGSAEDQLFFSGRYYMFGCGSEDGSANNPTLQVLNNRMCAERNRISKQIGKALEMCTKITPPPLTK